MKTCVSSYSFQPMLSSGELTQLQLIGKVKEMGFDGIEFIDLLPEDGMSVEEYAKRLRDESEKKNLPIVNYTIGAELLNRPLDEECERLFRQVDIAEILGASGMRTMRQAASTRRRAHTAASIRLCPRSSRAAAK